jgi:hypothetical protein
LGVPLVYYRLKSIDIDGRFSYSAIVVLTVNSTTVVSLYPNPVKGSALLALTVTQPTMLQLRIIDNAGRTVRQEQYNVLAGTSTLPLNASMLSKGVYYLELKGKAISQRIRFVRL